MDSTNPALTGFVNLLTSQQENQYTFPTTIELGSAEPRFSQFTLEEQSGPGEDRKVVRRQWTPTEDKVLISAWLNTSKDPVVGNDQKAGPFWKRIQKYFNSTLQLVGANARESTQVKQRWGRLNNEVCKFVGCFEAAMKEQSSGMGENDLMKAAHEIFFNDYGAKFTLEHAWRELRHDQKWCSNLAGNDGGKAKRRKVDDSSPQSPSCQPDNIPDDVPQTRPPGIKAAKAGKAKVKGNGSAARKAEGNPVVDMKSMWDMKRMDLDMKDKISKRRLLEGLLVKTEPLTDKELALKDILISEML
ncbi:glutathione S-transferase T3-like [Eutrema salsugineum]|uniref:glutathione S-transferase T3-like n=1 Tax=Eutrema salsugineum TaxID=72664 RepID=UPI000CED64F6|nr:glutathione S-transferase T3-like [Eutrema salsugineum]